ncbi:MAG: TetR/AcrR family transcriptional regulator [Spirochaetales bacterium]|nr:TetR/AcrR family transcriptional regulator [Spirochaetales bacterium]
MKKTFEKKQFLMDITRDLILEVGLPAASIGKIAKKSGIPVGSIYHAFENKEDLVNQVYVRSRDRIVNIGNMQGKDSIENILRDYFLDYINNALSNRQDFLFVERYHLSPVIDRKRLIKADIIVGELKLTDLMEQGIIKKGAPDIIDTAIVGMLHNSIAACLCGMINLDETGKKQLVQLCLDAIICI